MPLNPHRRILSAGAWVTFCIAASACATDAPVMAHWQRHAYEFHYVGFDSAYSCDWLEEKLRLLLKTSGARADVKISGSCIVLNGPSPDATAKMLFYTLAPERSTGDQPESGPTRVLAQWRQVSLRHHSPIALESLDCELVAQFRDRILPMFTTRNLIDRTRCRPGENSSYQLNLQYDVLAAPADAAK